MTTYDDHRRTEYKPFLDAVAAEISEASNGKYKAEAESAAFWFDYSSLAPLRGDRHNRTFVLAALYGGARLAYLELVADYIVDAKARETGKDVTPEQRKALVDILNRHTTRRDMSAEWANK